MTTRRITAHAITELDAQLHIHAVDERGPNGDNHQYVIAGPGFSYSLQDHNGTIRMQADAILVKFHQGNPEHGFNGVTLESLLAICADRLVGCQKGPFASHHNHTALQHIEAALDSLHSRTRQKQVTSTGDGPPASLLVGEKDSSQ